MAEHDCSECFICRSYEHIRKCWPDAVAELQEPETRWLIHRGLVDAKEHGFISERDVARFIDLDFALGRDWPDDRRFVAIQAHLRDRSTTPGKRMERLYKESATVLGKSGAGGLGHGYRIPPTTVQPEAARRFASRTWKVAPGLLEVDDVSGDYMWLRGSPLFNVSDNGGHQMLVASLPDGRTFDFDDTVGIERKVVKLNGLLHAQRVRPLWAIPVKEHSKMLWHFLLGTGGFVGSWEFLNGQRAALPQWIMHCPSDGPALFEKCCEEPRAIYGPNQWTIDFNYFNTRGGVERWHTSGNQEMVVEASKATLVPDGKFTFPC